MNLVRYYSVFSDFRQQEYDSLESANSASDFVVITEDILESPYGHGNIAKKISLEVFSKDHSHEKCVLLNGWKFEITRRFFDGPGPNQISMKVKHVFRFTDPTGAVKEFTSKLDFLRVADFEWLISYLKLFKAHAEEKNMRAANLTIENSELKQEIEKLKLQIESMSNNGSIEG